MYLDGPEIQSFEMYLSNMNVTIPTASAPKLLEVILSREMKHLTAAFA